MQPMSVYKNKLHRDGPRSARDGIGAGLSDACRERASHLHHRRRPTNLHHFCRQRAVSHGENAVFLSVNATATKLA